MANKIIADPLNAFREDERLFIEALNSLRWYELTRLITKEELHSILTDSIIRKLFPVQRRYYYTKQEDYYQNILYPLQDKVLEIVGTSCEFYLTGGTALSRAYCITDSDDLDFFLNRAQDFKQQVNEVTRAFSSSSQQFEVANTDENYARIFITGPDCTLKLDFVNDVAFRRGLPVKTSIFIRTDTILNILSNKLSALSRYATKDLVDIVFISENTPFTWEEIFDDASQKDLCKSKILPKY